MRKYFVVAYGGVCYVMFLGVFVYSIGFLGNFGITRTLDSAPQSHWQHAVLVNTLLLGAFAIQHSGMARPGFKKWSSRLVPSPVERSTYVLCSNVAMMVLFRFWEPIGGLVWDVPSAEWRGAIYCLYGLGWITILYSTFLLNHFDLFGLRQVYLHFLGQPYKPLRFDQPGLYRHVRHPLYLGWLMVFWFAPTMSIAHLLFAVMCTIYILVAIQLEESDLADSLVGYAEYRVRVPMLIPSLRSREAHVQQTSGWNRKISHETAFNFVKPGKWKFDECS